MHGFIEGFALPIHLVSKYFIATEPSFYWVINHYRVRDRACIGTYKGGDKRSCYQYNVIDISSKSKDHLGRD